MYRLEDYDYQLPPELVAQEPAPQRDASRLLVLHRDRLQDLAFPDILSFFSPGDLLVCNNTRVFPARLRGCRETGGKVELFLLEYPKETPSAAPPTKTKTATAPALLKSSKRPKPGGRLHFGPDLQAVVEELLPAGAVRISLHYRGRLDHTLERHGHVPLPPISPAKPAVCNRTTNVTRPFTPNGPVLSPPPPPVSILPAN